ncbi:GTPase activating protein BUD2 [Rhizoctonia solani]|uniref:GTPase activating protein BUD2 n=1 Tax=Rhizoctonia solani TaxID=456999 RepID=A0A0K6G640_9AGAM|nr:GTPase activating protein BUD2 [Rhizoctonia solani]
MSYTFPDSYDPPDRSEMPEPPPLMAIPNMFRLLELVDEYDSRGTVEKIVIDQHSLSQFLNTVKPGSYHSVSKIDLKGLDQLSIKPVGVYGIRSEIIRFLQQAQCLNENSVTLLSQPNSLDESFALGSGLYLVLDPRHQNQGTSKAAYIVYWPEDTTWDDQAVPVIRRNRPDFYCSYLNKLTEQTISLVSAAQGRALIWNINAHNKDLPEHRQENDGDGRLFDFEVVESLKQENDAVGSPGFTVTVGSRLLPQASDRANSQVRLVPGEQKTALLVVRNEKEKLEENIFERNINSLGLRLIVGSKDCPLQLGNLAPAHLAVLAAHGLRSQYRQIFAKYDDCLRKLKSERTRLEAIDNQIIEDQTNRDRPNIKEEIQHLVRVHYDKLYPSPRSGFDPPHGPELTALLYERYPSLNKVTDEIGERQKPEIVQDRDFQSLKEKWPLVKGYLENNPRLSDDKHEDFINSIIRELNTDARADTNTTFTNDTRTGVSDPEFVSQLRTMGQTYYSLSGLIRRVYSALGHNLETLESSTGVSDPEFVSQLRTMGQTYYSLFGLIRRVYSALGRNLETLESSVVADQLDRIISVEGQRQKTAASVDRDRGHSEETRRAFEVVMQELREAMASNARQTRQVDWIRTYGGQADSQSSTGNAEFRWSGRITSFHPAQTRYSIYPLKLTEKDSDLCRADDAYVPQPTVDKRHKFEFTLAKGRSVEFIQLVREKCLVVVSEQGRTQIYIEENFAIDHAVNSTLGKILLGHDSLGGPNCKFAFDQVTRLLVIIHGKERDLKLSTYIFDDHFTNLRSRGSPVSLRNWYGNQPIYLKNVCFVSGLEEICLVETSGRARIFSLTTQQFRVSSLKIDRPIIDAFSAPDGSCLFVIVPGDQSNSHRLLTFHWALFGSNNNGIDSTGLPACDGNIIATRFDGRGQVHVVWFDAASKVITSKIIRITQKATKFSFCSRASSSLIDCHSEVWAKFPLVLSVARSTPIALDRRPRQLIFVSPVELPGVEGYFTSMISKFERTSRKPMAQTLAAIKVKSTSQDGGHIVNETSEFKLGSFIVELLCLIPLHLAMTKDYGLIPLKDGVRDPEYENTLLGADALIIASSLSLGWYESLFQSYMATKPIRVISSMGKSYWLNHFADTSFLGSAMHTAKGVWLSCTPMEEYLLVSLDFRGVNSARQATQEDAMLVLLNVAISNLVLFRNSFAISRDILDLFKNFRSVSNILDSNDNQELLNSTLAIIIKDTTDVDSKKIAEEFALKFKSMVKSERDQNFVTRLHRGHIQIIPWPVISSPSFYTLFGCLRQSLEQQPFTHGSGGAFLHKLKTLLAKIKIGDWGPINQDVAAHRAQQLMERLPIALSRGRLEEGPLKNMDVDSELETPDYMHLLFVPEFTTGDAAENELLADLSLRGLVQTYEEIVHTRHQIPDTLYVEKLQESTYETLDQRLTLEIKTYETSRSSSKQPHKA